MKILNKIIKNPEQPNFETFNQAITEPIETKSVTKANQMLSLNIFFFSAHLMSFLNTNNTTFNEKFGLSSNVRF